MSYNSPGSRPPQDRPPISFPFRTHRRLTRRQILISVLLFLLLLSGGLGGWGAITLALHPANAATRPSPPAKMTFQQFLQQGRQDRAYHGPFVFPKSGPHMPFSSREQLTDYAHLLPTAEPVRMTPLSQALSSSLMVGSTSTAATPLDLLSSDKRIELRIQPGSIDLSHATVAGGAAPSGALTLSFSEIHGHFAGPVSLLGSYQMQVMDGSGRSISGIRLRTPALFIYHYSPEELSVLDLDPGQLVMTWPNQAYAAAQAHQSLTDFVIPLVNDPTADTLTGQSLVLASGPLDMGGGDPQNQSPPVPHMASVQGNSGQLSYAYPLQLPPGPGGFVPQLSLNYSSSDTNERHSRTSPGSSIGEGWSLSLGSISADVYPNTSAGVGTWYFLSGIDNIGDRLVPDSTGANFLTEHISQLRVQEINPTSPTPCFHVWDTSGTYYEFGCTSDSLQYRTDSNGTRHNYRFDVNKIVAPSEGPSSSSFRLILVSYLQDKTTSGSYTTIRDAAIKQIVYGTGSINSITNPDGTIDFSYLAPFTSSPWATAYTSTNDPCHNPPQSTTLRCDDPLNRSGGLNAPSVISTFSLQTVTTYVGSDSSSSNKDYSYAFNYQDSPFSSCYDDYTQSPEYCAGSHLLSSVTPTAYQNGSGHQLKALVLGYTSPLQDGYFDTTHKISNGTQYYHIQTYWQYLNSYDDTSDGMGASIIYQLAYSNTHGTPNATNGDDRHDPFYCTLHTDCTGSYAYPDDRAWSVQAVEAITSSGKDSSSLSLATTTYNYRLAVTGTSCPAAGSDTDCVGDNWTPKGNTGNTDGDWQDYFHSEYRGFNVVYITSPAGDLTADTYASTQGWTTYEGNSGNFTAGHLYEEDVYRGNSTTGPLLTKTVNTYAGNNATANPCNGNYSGVYPPCEVMVTTSRTTEQEGTSNANAPWVEQDNTYDDYSSTSGLIAGYHNLLQAMVSSSNAPTLTKKWTYSPNNQTVGGWTYYTVNKVTHSEIDDNNNHVWQCQDSTYDEGSGVPTPSAGWPTTLKSYSNCANQSGSAITTYSGYDSSGNRQVTVDGVATANSSLYSSNGCTLSRPPIFTASTNWGASNYTSCTSYDSYNAQPSTVTNSFKQTSTITYDYTQGSLPTSAKDANNQTTSTTYSYDANSGSNDKRTVSISQPGEQQGSYTSQSNSYSTCTTSSTTPCFEIDSNSSLYSGAITRTFYDSMGRAVETRTPGPTSGYDTIVFTVYDDANNNVMKSVPFEVTSGTGWVDPNGAVDYQGVLPGGWTYYYDPLHRQIAYEDPVSSGGYTCSNYLTGGFTTCTNYLLGTVSGDSNTYDEAFFTDPNDNDITSFVDALGRTRYVQWVTHSAAPNEQKTIQYNVLNEPTSVVTTDLAPQSGQSITSVTTTAQYDDLGRMTSLSDPDRGTHTYSYDADGRLLSDVSGTRTIGNNYDLLGRVGCVQDVAPTVNATGACSGGNPYIQNTYDTTKLGTQGSSDFPVGRLTQSIATTYYPESTSATVTEQFEHDVRGRLTNETMQVTLPGGWNVTNPLPTYQLAQSYNDVNQLTTTTTSTNPSGQGYTTTQVYDSTTGVLTGLSNNGNATANLATLLYNSRAQLDTINFLTTTGSALAADQYGYDADLRPTSMNATWQSGSGTSGTLLSQSVGYDAASNVISLSTTQAAVPGQSGSGGSETQNFCYDGQNRLIWAGNSGTQPTSGYSTCGTGTLSNSLNGASYSSSYVYTHLGQLWQAPLNNGSTQYQYLYCDSSHPHQLTGLYPLGTTCSTKSGQVYTSGYDAWGNVNSRFYNGTTATLSSDNVHPLVEWNAGSTNQEWYLYDGSGNRVLRRSTSGSSTTMTIYAFGLEEHSYSGAGVTQSNTYYYTLAGRLLGAFNGTSTNFFLTDALGSVLSSFSNVASSASVQGNQVYGPYGTQQYQQGSMGTSKGFTGQYNDSTGLDYYGARYYDPVVGRFLSADGANGAGSDPYAYVEGNPETLNDPSGQMPCTSTGVCGWSVPSGSGSSGGGSDLGAPASNPVSGIGSFFGQVWNEVTLWYNQPQTAPAALAPAVSVAHGGDFLTGASSMVNDVHTFANPNASGMDKFGAGVDLTVNVVMDVSMLFGVGEELRADELLVKGSEELLAHAGEELTVHAEEDVATHAEEEVAAHGICSFTATTVVATAHGNQAIGTLHVGQKVEAYNPKTHKMELQPIVHVWVHPDHDLIDLTISSINHSQHGKAGPRTSEVVHTTSKHPFLTTEQGFVPAGQIKVGMHVVRADGSIGIITGWKIVPGIKVMYNLEVAQDHTFTVGSGQWVVHNCTNPPDLVRARQELGMPPRSLQPDEGHTLAILRADGEEFWGINGRKSISFDVNAISKDHAEIDALNQLYQARQASGITGGTATMWIDRPPCPACGIYGGIRAGVRAVGLDTLEVIYGPGLDKTGALIPAGSMIIQP